MPPRWNAHALVYSVQLDYEKTPKLRPVRLTAPVARVGDPVRVAMSGAEIEARIVAVNDGVLSLKVKPAQLRAAPSRPDDAPDCSSYRLTLARACPQNFENHPITPATGAS